MRNDRKFVIWDYGSQDRAGLFVHQFCNTLGKEQDVICFVRRSYVFSSVKYRTIRTLFFVENVIKHRLLINLFKYIDYYVNIIFLITYVALQRIKRKKVTVVLNVYQLLAMNYHLIMCIKHFSDVHLILHDVITHDNSLPQFVLTTQEKLIVNSDLLISFNKRSTDLLAKWGKPILELDFPPYEAAFTKIDKKKNLKKINILFIGNFRKEKKLEWLLDVWASCSGDEALDKLYLTVAGSGNLKAKNTSINVNIINQYIPDEQYNDLLKNAHFVIMPYRGVTNSGVLNDAIAAGVPCIVSDDDLFSQHKYLVKKYMFGDEESLKYTLRKISRMSVDEYNQDVEMVGQLRQMHKDAFVRSIANYAH